MGANLLLTVCSHLCFCAFLLNTFLGYESRSSHFFPSSQTHRLCRLRSLLSHRPHTGYVFSFVFLTIILEVSPLVYIQRQTKAFIWERNYSTKSGVSKKNELGSLHLLCDLIIDTLLFFRLCPVRSWVTIAFHYAEGITDSLFMQPANNGHSGEASLSVV